MTPDRLEKLQAALSVLNSCTVHQLPDKNALAVIAGKGGHPGDAAFDEMARAVVEDLKGKEAARHANVGPRCGK